MKRIIILSIICFILPFCAFAQGVWTVYNIENSDLPHNDVWSLAIDEDGITWIGTTSGLALFNGTDWTIYNTGNSGLPNNFITALAMDTDEIRWIGTNGGGLARFDGTDWTVYNTVNSGLPNDFVHAIAIDTDGIKWIGTNGGGVARFDGTDWTVYNTDNSGLPNNSVRSLVIDADDVKWIGMSPGGLARFDGEDWTVYNTENSGLPHNSIVRNSIAIEGDGIKWIGTAGGGLARFDGTDWTVYNTGNSDLSDNFLRSLAIEADEIKWIGMSFGGLARFDGTDWTVYNTENSGLPSDVVNAIAIDDDDIKWIGTKSGGLAQFDDDPTIYVVNTDDSGPGSLRQAIIDANANPGHDFIYFDIPGEGPHTIEPLSPLPSISESVTIDGYTQPGASPATTTDPAIFMIRLDGSEAGGAALQIDEIEGCIIRGLLIRDFDSGIGIAGDNNIIEGNAFRLNSAEAIFITGSHNTIGGDTPAQRNIISANVNGIVIFPGSSHNSILGNHIDGVTVGNDGISISGNDNIIKGNVISRNQSNGILIQRWDEESEIPGGNIIQGNMIGTNIPGDAAQPNGQGISINNAANNTIGGSTSDERNIISGNTNNGVLISGNLSTGNTVSGNFIGTDLSGEFALGNGEGGVVIDGGASGNTIGGMGNIISGNSSSGIHIIGNLSTGNVIAGNLIGTDLSGAEPIPNHWGITIENAPNNTVGGTIPGARNIISGNDDNAINILGSIATGNIISGNFIGTDITGEFSLGNGQRGIRIEQGASGNMIGGIVPGAGNIIAFNGSQGVQVLDESVSNAILSNSIHSNGFGIDLGDDGVTPNEIPEQDEGPNKLRNFPVLFLAGSDIQVVMGTLQSDPESVFRIEFFSNDVCDPTGHGEGEVFLGALEGIESDSIFVMSFEGTILTGKYITATATDDDNNTSEFSKCLLAGRSVRHFGENFVVNTTLSGIPLHWPDGRASYAISESVPEEFRDTIIAGFETWAAEFNELLTLTFMGVDESNTWGGVRDGVNNNVWITSNWEDSTGTHLNTIAITRVRYDVFTGAMFDVDIAYNAERFGWATDLNPDSMDVQNTATHEAGHFLGLGDIYNSGDPGYMDEMGFDNENETMYGLIDFGETHKQILHDGDKRGIQFVYGNLPDERISIVLVFDGSDSYAVTHGAFDPAKKSAIELVDKMRIGDRIGVVKIPDDVILTMTEINESNRSTIKSAISGMTPDPGGPAAIGEGLQTGQSLFSSVPSNYVHAMILFSAGEEDATPTIMDAVVEISPTQTEIYTIGMGGSTTQAKEVLSFAASETGGKYYLAEDATEIVNIVNYIWNFLTGRQLLYFVLGTSDDIENIDDVIYEGIWIQLVEQFPGIWIQLVEQFPGIWIQLAMVDEGASIIQPGIFWQGSDLDLVLVEPGTLRLITPDTAAVDPKIQFFSGDTYEFYVIEDPAPGEWGLGVAVKDFDDRPSEEFGLYVAAITDFTMVVSFEKERYLPSEAITVTAGLFRGGEQIFDTHVIGGAGVVDADVTAEITDPSDEQFFLPLFHTGNGVYRGTFMYTEEPGSYEFVIRAEGQNSQFTRESWHTVFVSIADVALEEVKSLIADLDDKHVKDPASQRKNALFNKIDEVIDIILAGNYQEAIGKLTHDILAKMDGHRGGNPRTDWIVTKEAQDELYPKVVAIIKALEEVMLLLQYGEETEPLASTVGDIPEKFDISQNFPNPFNPVTTIRYQLPEDVYVTIRVYNILGQLVRTLVDEEQSAGYYTIMWNGTNKSGVILSSGLYIYRIQAGDYTMVRKMMFVK